MAKNNKDAGLEERYPIQVVSRRTGLTPEVIRVWEKRYEVVSPERSATGRRMYSLQEIERLRLLRQATLGGRRIGDISGLTTKELTALAQEDLRAEHERPGAEPLSGPRAEAFREQAYTQVVALDGAGFQALLVQAMAMLNGMEFVEDFLSPLFERIGTAWEEGELDPHQEHLATSVVRGTLHQLFTSGTGDNSPVLVSATPAGHVHEVGALLAAVTATFAGYKVVHLGADLPAESIDQAARTSGASVVALSVVFPDGDSGVQDELKRLRDVLPRQVSLVLGGAAAAGYGRSLRGPSVHVIDGFRRLESVLRTLASTGTVSDAVS